MPGPASPPVGAIVIRGVERPGLGEALMPYGLAGGVPVAALVAEAVEPPIRPALVQASSPAGAVALLGRGADDVVLASDPDALVAARLAALVRRAPPAGVTCGEVAIDPVERRAARAGRLLALLPREYALLLRLARAGGEAVSRAELLRDVFRLRHDPGTNLVAVHCSRLRAELHRGGTRPILLTERGRGYRLVADPPGDA